MNHLSRAAFMAAIVTFATTVTACDDAPAEAAPLQLAPPPGHEAADVSFRDGEPGGLYITKWGPKPIRRNQFVQIIEACSVQQMPDPPQTCSLTWQSIGGDPEQFVFGVGCSTVGDAQLFGCYLAAFTANDATPY